MKVKAAVHMHSDWSYDGHIELSRICTTLGKFGYNVILMSEHDRDFDEARWILYRKACAEASTNTVSVIPGIEYSDPANSIHILVWGDLPFLGCQRETIRILQDVKRFNGVAVFAHPSRRDAWRLFDVDWLDYLTGIELWNRKVDGFAPSRDAMKIFSATGNRLLGFASLDFHAYNQLYPLAMQMELLGDIDERSVIEAVKNKRFKATCCGIKTERLLSGIGGATVNNLERLRKVAKIILMKDKK